MCGAPQIAAYGPGAMVDRVHLVLVFAAAIGSGVVAGVFFAFSSFVMSALGKLPPAQGVAAMQSINLTVMNASFFIAFFGTALVCVVLAIVSGFRWQSPASSCSCWPPR